MRDISDKKPVVWSVLGWNDHWRPIIAEAMIAYESGHGQGGSRYVYLVRFGADGDLFTKDGAI